MNDYRNSVVAGMMKTLNYVNMFNHGIGEVQDLLRANENPEAVFNVSYLTAFSVVVKDEEETNCSPTVHQLVTNLSPKSKQLFRKQFLYPSVDAGLIALTHLENPHHPQQKYFLTELEEAVLKLLAQQNRR